jgi:hypothetical protein
MLVTCVISCLLLFSAAGRTQSALLDDMQGTWNVEQRMWPMADAAAVEMPAAVAERRLIEGKFLEETMQPKASVAGQRGFFVRHAVLNYNVVGKHYEYFSIDTRAPQAMTYKSAASEMDRKSDQLKLSGGTFVAAEWGAARNITFNYRLTVSPVRDGKQTVALYLTPLTVLPKKEFLAFEYKYIRQP